MQAIVRNYSGEGAREVFRRLSEHREEIEKLMGAVQGIVSYTLAQTAEGGISITVWEEREGVEENMQKARDFIARTAGDAIAAPPVVTEGPVIAHLP